jgi:hypothetical protein
MIAVAADDPDAKILSLELFNRNYWNEEPLHVARTGLEKMKSLVKAIT